MTTKAPDTTTTSALVGQIVQASVDAVVCSDAAGTILTWNLGAERLYGADAATMIGESVDSLISPEARPLLEQARARALGGEPVERFDTWQRHMDGTVMAVNASVIPLRGADGSVVAVATTVADVSVRVELAAELERVRADMGRQNLALARSNRDLEQFAYVASHDLSEPLRVITGYVAHLERRYEALLDDRGHRYMAHIVEACTRMRAMIDDLLEYARYLRVDVDAARVPLGAVLAQTVDGLGTDAVVVEGELPEVWADRYQVISLLQNLLSNALKFVPEGRRPHVRVSATVEAGEVLLVVDDNGIGIDPEYRERVFRMFQRLHVREAYEGSGIGLAIAQQVVERNGGRIWCENSPLGGARFCCTLPEAPRDCAGGYA